MTKEFTDWLRPLIDKTIVNKQLKTPIYSDVPDIFKLTVGELYNIFSEETNKIKIYKIDNEETYFNRNRNKPDCISTKISN